VLGDIPEYWEMYGKEMVKVIIPEYDLCFIHIGDYYFLKNKGVKGNVC